MQNFTFRWQGHRTRDLNHTRHISRGHFLVFHDHHAVARDPSRMATPNANTDIVNFTTGAELRFLHRFADRVHGGIDVNNQSFAQSPLGKRRADTDHLNPLPGIILATMTAVLYVPISRLTNSVFSLYIVFP